MYARNFHVGMFDETTDAGPTELRPNSLSQITLPDIPPYTVSLTGESEVILGRARNARVQLDHRTGVAPAPALALQRRNRG